MPLTPAQLNLLDRLASGGVITRYGTTWHDGANDGCGVLDGAMCETWVLHKLIAMHERGNGREAFVATAQVREIISKYFVSHP